MRETFIYFEFLIKKKQHELYLISASFIYYKLKTLALYTCNAEIKKIKNTLFILQNSLEVQIMHINKLNQESKK